MNQTLPWNLISESYSSMKLTDIESAYQYNLNAYLDEI